MKDHTGEPGQILFERGRPDLDVPANIASGLVQACGVKEALGVILAEGMGRHNIINRRLTDGRVRAFDECSDTLQALVACKIARIERDLAGEIWHGLSILARRIGNRPVAMRWRVCVASRRSRSDSLFHLSEANPSPRMVNSSELATYQSMIRDKIAMVSKFYKFQLPEEWAQKELRPVREGFQSRYPEACCRAEDS